MTSVAARWVWRAHSTIGKVIQVALLSGSSLLAAEADESIRDIRGLVEIPNPWKWVWMGLAVVVGVGLGYSLWKWWKGRKRDEFSESPAERARQALREALGLTSQPEQFVTRVSEIVRRYLEEECGWKAPERTTEEFLLEIQRNGSLGTAHHELLASFLSQCDLVKFARHELAHHELDELHNSAMRVIDEVSSARTSNTEPSLGVPPTLPESSDRRVPVPTNGSREDERYLPPMVEVESEKQ